MQTEAREYQKAIDYLCGLVREGKLEIGSKIPTERKLAEQLSIGRNSTREALRILEHMGVIACRQGSGNYIVGQMQGTISKAIEMMLLFKQVTGEELILFRREMEKAVCSSIIESGSMERWQEELSGLLLSQIDSQSLEEQIETDQKFHSMLVQATENRLWICISESVAMICRQWISRILRNADQEIKRQFQEAHMLLLSGLREGSTKVCWQAVDAHYDLANAQLRRIAKQKKALEL